MHPIERVIAEGTNRGHFLARGAYGKVYHHGSKRVYKEGYLDGTGLWIERCFEVQQRLGMDHPLCEFMPEVFFFKKDMKNRSFVAVMGKYTTIHYGDLKPGLPKYDSIPQCFSCGQPEEIADLASQIVKRVEDVIGRGNANDLHGGNILWCERDQRWVVVDPSSASYDGCACYSVDRKFLIAKPAVKQYGPRRSH